MRLILLLIASLLVGCAATPPVVEEVAVEETAPSSVEMPAHFVGVYELVTDQISYGDTHLLRISPTRMEVFGIASGQRVGAKDGGIAYEMTVLPAEYIHRGFQVTKIEDLSTTLMVTIESEALNPMGEPKIEHFGMGTSKPPGEVLVMLGKKFVKNNELADLIDNYQERIRIEDDLRRIYAKTKPHRDAIMQPLGLE